MPLVWGLVITIIGVYYWACAKGKIKFKNAQAVSKSQKRFGLAAMPFLVFMFLWCALLIGVGKTYTVIYGVGAYKVMTVKKKQGKDKTCLESMGALKTGFMKEMCVRREDYEAMPTEAFLIRVLGKESWFGFEFQKYVLPESWGEKPALEKT